LQQTVGGFLSKIRREIGSRFFTSRDLQISIQHLQSRLEQYSRTRLLYLADEDELLRDFARPKLCAMLRWIHEDPQRHPTFNLSALYLHAHFERRWRPRDLVRPKTAFRIVLPYTHQLEDLNLNNILRDANSLLPASLFKVIGRPEIVYKPNEVSALLVLRNRAVADSSTASALLTGRSSMCACHLFDDRYKSSTKYCNEAHLLTTEYDALQSQSISTFLGMGSKYRSSSLGVDAPSILEYLEARLKDFRATAARETGVHPDALDAYVTGIMDAVEEALDNMEDPSNLADFQRLARLQEAALRDLKPWRRCVTVKLCDKSPGRYVLVCRWMDIAESRGLIDHLGDSYEKAGSDEQGLARHIADACSVRFRDVVWHEEHDARSPPSQAHPLRPTKVGPLYTNYKLHKATPTGRPIVGALLKPETPTANRVTAVLKLVAMAFCDHSYHDVLLHLFGWVSTRSHMLFGCDDFAKTVDSINALFSRGILDIEQFLIGVYDFKAMYTKFSHTMMKEALHHIVSYAFRAEHARRGIQFIAVPLHNLCKLFAAVWLKTNNLPDTLPGGAGCYTVWNLEDVILRLNFLIANSYFTFGGELHRLCVGVAMGLSPASFIANLTCFYYEMLYLTRLLKTHKAHCVAHPVALQRLSSPLRTEREDLRTRILTMITLSRYIDDCIFPAINGMDPKTLHYDDRTALDGSQDGSSLDGIFPRRTRGPNGTMILMPCELEEVSAPSRCAQYLDFSLVVDLGKRRIVMKVYDKRDNMPVFANSRTFPHIDSGLSNKVKYGVVSSQLIRFTRRCSSMSDFAACAARLIENMISHDYKPRALRRRLVAFGSSHWDSTARRLGAYKDFVRRLYILVPQLSS
jgi:hypothetical protein